MTARRLARLLRVAVYQFAVALLVGCAHTYPINAQPTRHDMTHGYRFSLLPAGENSDSLLLILTFSGGGTRAAALSYGVLEQLARTRIRWEGKDKRLLDEVDIISAVSGGSVTAAYYALHGDKTFQDFESAFLKRNVQGDLRIRFLSPFNWPRLSSPRFGRSDIVTEYFHRHLFSGATYADLLARGRRPFLMVNATDMAAGNRFEFSQEQFDLLCADLSQLPIARAVAASSAFPIAFSPITLRNDAGRCGYTEPEWIGKALQARTLSSRRFNQAVDARSYLDAKVRPFVHLLDGGLADNLGLRGPLDAVIAEDDAWNVTRQLQLRKVRHVAFIVVNAANGRDLSWNQSEGVPGLRQVITAIKDIPIDRYSFETKELLRGSFDKWSREVNARNVELTDRSPVDAQVRFYLIEVDFEALRDERERNYFKQVPTSLSLPNNTVDELRAVAGRLMES